MVVVYVALRCKRFLRPLRFVYRLIKYKTGSLFVCHSAPNQGRFALSRITDYGTSKRGSPDLAGARLTNPAPQPLTGSLEAHVNQPSAPYTDPSLDIEYSLSLSLSCLAVVLEHQYSRVFGAKKTLEHQWVASAASPSQDPHRPLGASKILGIT